MIGFVEARTLEDYPGREENAANMISTLGTHGQRLIGHFLPRLEAVAAGLTEILVRWHIPITSYKIERMMHGQHSMGGYAIPYCLLSTLLTQLPM